MLQQTQVSTVIGYFDRFIKRFPTVQSLASAPETDVLRHWEGLGYYRRARQLHLAAQQIVDVHQGVLPQTTEGLQALPGIGRYTAGAIASIAFDIAAPIVEANTARLYSRLIGMRAPIALSNSQRRLWDFAANITPRKSPGEFNQALMEVGSLICTPREPNCKQCPVRNLCATYEHGLQEVIPAAGKKTVYEDVVEIAVVIKNRDQYLLRRCGAKERWAGLWDFPRFSVPKDHHAELQDNVENSERLVTEEIQSNYGLKLSPPQHSRTIKHAVTKYRITLHVWQATTAKRALKTSSGQETSWLNKAEMADLPLCVTGRKIARQL